MDDVTDEQVREVFDYWVNTVKYPHGGKGKRPILDPKREEKIRNAISWFGVEVCKQAIEGVLYSDFHMGKNKAGKKYNDIELILRNGPKVEQFLSYYEMAQRKGVAPEEEVEYYQP